MFISHSLMSILFGLAEGRSTESRIFIKLCIKQSGTSSLIIWATDMATTLKNFRENGSKTVFRVGWHYVQGPFLHYSSRNIYLHYKYWKTLYWAI